METSSDSINDAPVHMQIQPVQNDVDLVQTQSNKWEGLEQVLVQETDEHFFRNILIRHGAHSRGDSFGGMSYWEPL